MNYNMKALQRLALCVSVVTSTVIPFSVHAQEEEVNEVVVTGIRSSLQKAMEIKRNARGIVDAITAEDIGAFPDTNLAESLQRISGVTIDRKIGEGREVTVRGWAADYNLVTLNGRQMPTSTLGDQANSAPYSRSFDFSNLAPEAVAAVEVYKTGRADTVSGGIGSTLNIITPKPLGAAPTMSITLKGVYDESRHGSNEVTPEVSGIFIDQFMDDRLGVSFSFSHQERKSGTAEAQFDEPGWMEANLVGTSTVPGDVTNPPSATDIITYPQNIRYQIGEFEHERLNGQLTLQYQLADNLVATTDYTHSTYRIHARRNRISNWFSNTPTESTWTDGPAVSPLVYTDDNLGFTLSSNLAANENVNKSLGFNLDWAATDNLTLEFDFHDSSAESKPDLPWGSNNSISVNTPNAATQTLDLRGFLPILSFAGQNDMNADGERSAAVYDVSQYRVNENSFHNAYMSSDIKQLQVNGSYEFASGDIDSVDFGISFIENKVRSAHGSSSRADWGNQLITAADVPDELFTFTTLPNRFDGISGGTGNLLPGFYTFNFESMLNLLTEQNVLSCNDGNCLADYTTDRRITEETTSAYLQFNNSFDVNNMPAHLRAGVRYEKTEIDAAALVNLPVEAKWTWDNQITVTLADDATFFTGQGEYDYFLPAIDFDIDVREDVKLRASYSKTIARPTYDKIHSGFRIDNLVTGPNDFTASVSNPDLLPLSSKNLDLSAEWYYGESSYIALGWFDKEIRDLDERTRFASNFEGIRNPAAIANEMIEFSRNYIQAQSWWGGGVPTYEQAANNLGTMKLGNNPALPAEYVDRIEVVASFLASWGGQEATYIRILPNDTDPLLSADTQVYGNTSRIFNVDGMEFSWQHDFADTGYGFIVNYTVINSDADNYDNSIPGNVVQTLLPGASDSANLVGYYDKNNLQVRLAYTWRDRFLTGQWRHTYYVEEYEQIDVSARYSFPEQGVTLFADIINLTEEDRRVVHRNSAMIQHANPGKARYILGATYKF